MQQFKFKIKLLVNEGDISPTSPDPIESIILKKEMVKWKYMFLLQFYICQKKKLVYTHGKDATSGFILSFLFVAECRCHCHLLFKKKFANHTKNEQKHLAPLSIGVSA